MKIEIKEIEDLHQAAIKLCNDAILERLHNNLSRSIELYKEAFELEKQAAFLAKEYKIGEPSQRILIDSAYYMGIYATLKTESDEFKSIIQEKDLQEDDQNVILGTL